MDRQTACYNRLGTNACRHSSRDSAKRLHSRRPPTLKHKPQWKAPAELLLPILVAPVNCQIDCQQVVEVRIYQLTQFCRDQQCYQLVSQMPVAEPEEYFVLSTLMGESRLADASRSLPLTKLQRSGENAPPGGNWFNLLGQVASGDTSVTYGQVIHYNPEQLHLSVMLQWRSPNKSQPYWKNITGKATPELVVTQTVGLEPHFEVYQLQPRKFLPNPIYLEEISLAQPAFDTPAYRNAMILARSGLWSSALPWLQLQKQKNWSPVAQAQLDVIQLHAQVTAAQAKQAWASPSSTILAQLIDGRWAKALGLFQAANAEAVREIARLLRTDSGGLWRRVEAALRVNPKDSSVKAWGALLLANQQDRSKAIAWLQQRSPSTLTNTAQHKFLDHLDAAFAQASLPSNHLSQIVGTAQLVKAVNPKAWLQPQAIADTNPLLQQREAQQVWYQIQVAVFNDGQRWRQTPFSVPLSMSEPAEQLWNDLGLRSDPQIQITAWSGEGRQDSTIATVKAVSYRGGVIQLLAAGEALPAAQRSRPLAHTQAALHWLEPNSITVGELNQLQPQWVAAILPTLRREVLKSPQPLPSLPLLLNEMGDWSIQTLDLTGNSEPEAVLTIYEDLVEALKKPEPTPARDTKPSGPRTLIFSDTGALLYSEFSKDAGVSLSAIANLGDAGPVALVINGKTHYSIKRWSPQRRRFE